MAANNPFGGQEEARKASAEAQEARVRIRIPPNTTLFGVGGDATLIGAWLDIRGNTGGNPGALPMNVIVRNISFQDTIDCFPEWSPTDNVTGNWNAVVRHHLGRPRHARVDRSQPFCGFEDAR